MNLVKNCFYVGVVLTITWFLMKWAISAGAPVELVWPGGFLFVWLIWVAVQYFNEWIHPTKL